MLLLAGEKIVCVWVTAMMLCIVRVMLMDKVVWQDGWPVVGVPSDSPQTAPLGHWIPSSETQNLVINNLV